MFGDPGFFPTEVISSVKVSLKRPERARIEEMQSVIRAYGNRNHKSVLGHCSRQSTPYMELSSSGLDEVIGKLARPCEGLQYVIMRVVRSTVQKKSK
jgi:hypothetical protein